MHAFARSIAIALTILVIGMAGGAAGSEGDDRARQIFHDYMSPFCPGLLLADCSSRPAATLRSEIGAALASGRSESEVRADLERRFGEKILAAPVGRGFGLLAWLVPPVGVVGALAAVVIWWSRRSRTRLPAPLGAAPSPVDGELRARFERELTRF